MTELPNTIKLLNGMQIDTSNGEVVSDPEAESGGRPEDAQDSTAIAQIVARKRIAELPDSVPVMNVTGVVLMYAVWGLPTSEIALALNTTVDKIEAIQISDAYTTARTEIVANLINSMQDEVRGVLATHAKSAAHKMVGMLNSKSEDTRRVAAADILDRAGFSPQAIITHRHTFEDELVMRVIKDDKTATSGIQTIDLKVIDG